MKRKAEITREVHGKAGLAPRWALGWWRRIGILCLILFGTAILLRAQDEQSSIESPTFTTLFSFDGTNGSGPTGALVQGTDGNFYGTAVNGGSNACSFGCGTVFKITTSGTLTTLYGFSGPDGSGPSYGLVLATDGNFYGTTGGGGTSGDGTVFKITPGGSLTTLYTFAGADGSGPNALIQAADGNFYGTTLLGGADGDGTVFKITPAGKLTTLYSFCSQTNCLDGADPEGVLAQSADGSFYGTTYSGGTNGFAGSVFKITASGTFTSVHSFNGTDGQNPNVGPVVASDGNLYGTTHYGGTGPNCFVGCGTVYKLTPGGALTTIYNFGSQSGDDDGANPGDYATLIQAIDGNLYGATANGGVNGCGTVFSITRTGTLTNLHQFDCSSEGFGYDGLFQGTNGVFYAQNPSGGTGGQGEVYSLSIGLGPFVETLPTSGKVGARIQILGTDLTGATGVSFNGTPAVFQVVSKTLIAARVPAGATTGAVTVTTPMRTLTSNRKFQVRP